MAHDEDFCGSHMGASETMDREDGDERGGQDWGSKTGWDKESSHDPMQRSLKQESL